MADRGGIQLLPETRKRIEVSVPGENKLLYIGIAIFAVVAVSYGVLRGVTATLAQEVKQKNTRIVQLNAERNVSTEEKLLSLSKQSESVQVFLANHIFWTQALAKVEQALQQQVQIQSLNATADAKTITFVALAPSYSSIARQIASLVADEGVLDVDISGARASNAGGYEFSVTLKFDETKYLKKNGQ